MKRVPALLAAAIFARIAAFAAAALAVAAFAAQAADSANAPAKPDPAKGQKIATQVCAACHGADGNSSISANPHLAGQFPEYLQKQIMSFKPAPAGKKPERDNSVMMGMVANLSADDVRDVAAYYAGQKAKPGAARNKETLETGRKIYRGGDNAKGVPACAACHGATGAGLPSQYPRLAGQYAEYTEAQLKAFRSGTRTNDPNRMMRTIAARMSDEEMRAVADYIAGLR